MIVLKENQVAPSISVVVRLRYFIAAVVIVVVVTLISSRRSLGRSYRHGQRAFNCNEYKKCGE